MKKRIHIFDTTLRDGEQAPGFSMNLDEKVRLARQLELLKPDVIEAGFPISSEGDFLSVKEIAKTVSSCTIAGLARAKKGDIDRAWEALQYAKKPRIHTFIATSDIHMEHKLKKTKEEVLENAVWAVEYACSLCPEVEFSAEDATRTNVDFLCQIVEAAIAAGAKVINIPDTVGYALPWEFGQLVKTLKERVPNMDQALLSVHCHNDLGLGVANSLMAVKNGADQIECTINGIGERAGNAALEELAMAFHTRAPEFDQELSIDTTQLYPSSRLLSDITGMQVQVNKAIVGKNAFSHEAGIHQDGVLKNPLTYEIMTPQSVGLSSNQIVLGKHSGRRALSARLEQLGYSFSKEEMEKVYEAFIAIADKKKIVEDDDLRGLDPSGIDDLSNRFIKETMKEYLNRQ
ncbi:2-isopropylmalate synthase [Balneolaceae bacterium ANBcel3]|nr:2-isopropylmalate synthase [Balneolaceae bacterium ANBcel3]